MKKSTSKHSIRLKGERTPNFVSFLIGRRDGKRKLISLLENEPQSDFISKKKSVFSGYCASVLDLTFQEISKSVQSHRSICATMSELTLHLQTLKAGTYSTATSAETRNKVAAECQIQSLEQQLSTMGEQLKTIETAIHIAHHEALQLLVSKKALLDQHICSYLKGARVFDSTLRAVESFALPEAQIPDIETLEGFAIYQNALPDINFTKVNQV